MFEQSPYLLAVDDVGVRIGYTYISIRRFARFAFMKTKNLAKVPRPLGAFARLMTESKQIYLQFT